MGKQQLKLLLCAVAAVVALLVSLFASAWFRMDVTGSEVEIDLRSAMMCGPNDVCVSMPLSNYSGFFPIAGSAAFFAGIVVIVVVIIQAASRVVTGTASSSLTKGGYIVAATSMIAGLSAGFLFAPESIGDNELAIVTVTRTPAPLLFLLGNLAALAALYLATVSNLDDGAAEYKPIKLDKAEKGRLPVTPLSVKGITPPQATPVASPAGTSARERLPDSLPLDGGRPRKQTPSGQHRLDAPTVRFTPSQQIPRIDDPARSKSPTQPPNAAAAGAQRTRTASQQPLGIVEVDARSKSPSQQPLVIPLDQRDTGARSKSPSQAPGVVEVDARAKSPSLQSLGGPVDPVQRSRTSSSGPIDLAARLSAAAPQGALEPLGASPVAVAIRPPLPQPEPVPADQIPVDPAAGLTIRKRPASVAPPIAIAIATPPPPVAPPEEPPVDPRKKTLELPDSAFAPPIAIEMPPESGLLIRKKSETASQRPHTSDGMPAVALDAVEGLSELKDELSKPHDAAARVQTKPLALPTHEPETVFPPYIQNKIKYAIVSADITASGITARREDGTTKLIEWDAIVGVIARRLPPEKPFEGATIIDVISGSGATLRLVPWTKVRGGLPLPPQAVERARSFVNLVAAQALGAKLDPATKLFADSDGQAAQLPTLATLASHDDRLA